MTDFNGNLDAYHDGLMHAHNDAYDYDPPWTVVCADDGEDGYLVIDEYGVDDGDWYETEAQAQAEADRKNKEELEDGYYF